jgi:tetratricopeptide (TPR) repeat protein
MRGWVLACVALVSVTAVPLVTAGAAAADDVDTCYNESGDDAIAACARIITARHANRRDIKTAYVNRGQKYYMARDYDRAIADFDAALKLDPRDPIAFCNRGNAWSQKNEGNRAIADYTRAIAIDHGYAAAYTGRGLVYEGAGDRDKARANYRAALAAPIKYQDGQWAHETAQRHLQELGSQ